ncbi:GntR family transcriptional regulator, regulator for abcA and norABC [Succinivibrio dextrinosolvens DSM 3072]|uniref:GntR family transcriptional regulator, regulator for abcA and norABC n=1 Tax=Succinivibrio dextrinosolvens DSM 3072 TaxID=1123324 RepID=A0A1T4V2H0_9GAMM|nr:PLP-dependent aminotransferase family protein [Succinivibrio dextrinosolvens]SKA59118.1 GntR family transcriptional regulator, regulator for abcA and norABC [Succinivibrio dextrinosolvens DSM 3072]
MKNCIEISWKPDRTSSIPAYQQIIDFFLSSVSSGAFAVGMRLPSQRKLSELFEVNRSTVSTAIAELSSYGIIKGSYGAGTEIASNTWSVLLKSNQSWSKHVLSGNFKENISTLQMINQLEFERSLLRLGTGELDPRLFPVKLWQKALSRVGKEVVSLGYLEPLGLYELRCEIARHLKKIGINTSPKCILITSGSLQALQLISVCLLKSGSKVFVEAPSYLKSLQVFQSAGLELTGISMDKDGMEYWKMLPLLKPSAKENTSVVYTIPSNHNPTGICMSDKRREELLDFCLTNRIPVIEDGAYQELSFDDCSFNPIKFFDQNGMVIYLGTASKTLSPGLRIGWLVAPQAVVKRLGDAKMQMDYGASSVSQYIFLEFLRSGMYDDYLFRLKSVLKKRLDNALNVLSENFSSIADWTKPHGGFYIWLTFRAPIRSELLFNAAIKEGILLNPGDIYDFKDNNSLRLSYAYITESEFEKGATTLKKLIIKLQSEHGRKK